MHTHTQTANSEIINLRNSWLCYSNCNNFNARCPLIARLLKSCLKSVVCGVCVCVECVYAWPRITKRKEIHKQSIWQVKNCWAAVVVFSTMSVQIISMGMCEFVPVVYCVKQINVNLLQAVVRTELVDLVAVRGESNTDNKGKESKQQQADCGITNNNNNNNCPLAINTRTNTSPFATTHTEFCRKSKFCRSWWCSS